MDSRTRVVILAVTAILVVGLVWALSGQRGNRATGGARIALVCGVPPSLFQQLPRPLGADQASREVRRDPSLIGDTVPALWRVYEHDDTRTYIAGQPPTVHVTTLKLSGGRWRWSGGGGCHTFVEPPGRASAIWAIPREGIDRAALAFSVVATDRQCASGRSADERVGRAHVTETELTVTVTFTASKPDGGFHTCPGHANAIRVVKLTVPLGDRALLDGGVYPPQPACVVGGPPPEPEYCDSHFYA